MSTPYTPVETGDSLLSYFENQNKLMEYSKSLSAFPSQGDAFNDLTGRYSLKSQQQDRLNKSRSLPYCSLDAVPSFVNNNKRVCRFLAHVTELQPHNVLEQIRTRVVEIALHMEDNSIEITEPKIRNSGLLQGKLLKRHRIVKPMNSRLSRSASTSSLSSRPSTGAVSPGLPNGVQYFGIEDFCSGARLEIYNMVYTVYDCDGETKRYMEEQLGRPFGATGSVPSTLYDPSKFGKVAKRGKKQKKENKMAGFYEYDRKVLRFFGTWDSSSQFFGDELYVRLHYSLAENTMEVMPVHTRNSGRDKLAKLLKKTIIMKPGGYESAPAGDTMLGESGFSTADLAQYFKPARPYHWTDLSIGMKISVAALDIKIIDADEFTREFYVSKNMPLDQAIVVPKPQYPTIHNEIPPHNGFGSEADSLQTCKTQLQPSAPSKDGAKAQLYQGMILRFAATMENPKPEDLSRKFIIQVHLEDDTIQVREPPIRNSGHKGGIFLSRSNLERHDGTSPIRPKDIYLGTVIPILSHMFRIHDADDYTLKFMEENCNLWEHSRLSVIVEKLRDKQEVVSRLILTVPGVATRVMSYAEIEALFAKAHMGFVKQEVVTLLRVLDPQKLGKVKLSTVLKYMMDHRK